ncbi:MAG: type restriction enzyme subunit, partial [Thermodesulfobacteriota bacterium]|nr:type restriction enzyme subunit [Thermodesulfobacteriota bacterium]
MAIELPYGWAITALSDAVKIVMGQSPPSSSYNNLGEGLPFFQGKAEFGDLYPKISKFCNKPKKISNPGDILVSVRAPVGPANICKEVSCIGRGLASLRPKGEISAKYLFRFMRNIEPWLSRQGSGSTFNAISKRDLEQLEFLLAPLNEQHRIVAKLEKLLAKVDDCKERLEKIPAILKRFRQSVLAAACSGTLTADWRSGHNDLDPAFELLENNKEERKKKYLEMCEKARIAGKRKPQPFRTNTENHEPEYLADIPVTWVWERLVNISHIQGGVTKGRKFVNKSTTYLPYLRVANVQDGFLDLEEIKLIEALPEDLEKYRLEYGDILFTEGGDRDKLGRGAVWKNAVKDCIHQNHIFRARLYSPKISPDFISLESKSEIAKKYFFENASQTVNLASINMTTLGNLP